MIGFAQQPFVETVQIRDDDQVPIVGANWTVVYARSNGGVIIDPLDVIAIAGNQGLYAITFVPRMIGDYHLVLRATLGDVERYVVGTVHVVDASFPYEAVATRPVSEIVALRDDDGLFMTGATFATAYEDGPGSLTMLVTITELTTGVYRFTFEPSEAGYWASELVTTNTNPTRRVLFQFDVVELPAIEVEALDVAIGSLVITSLNSGVATLAPRDSVTLTITRSN